MFFGYSLYTSCIVVCYLLVILLLQRRRTTTTTMNFKILAPWPLFTSAKTNKARQWLRLQTTTDLLKISIYSYHINKPRGREGCEVELSRPARPFTLSITFYIKMGQMFHNQVSLFNFICFLIITLTKDFKMNLFSQWN